MNTSAQQTRQTTFAITAAAALALLAGSPAVQAQAVLPGFMPTPVLPGDPYGLPIGRWFIEYSATSANALVDGLPSQDLHVAVGPQNGGLATASLTSSSVGAKLASASSSVAATRLAAQANARDALNPASTLTAATAFSVIEYRAILPTADAVTLDFHLTGQLSTTGDRAQPPDPTRAGVAVGALGSLSNGSTAAYEALYSQIGLVPVDGSFSIEQFAAWPTTSQRNLATFGSLATVASPSQAVDATFSVTADGTLIDCAVGLVPACGNYYFFFAVYLMAGAENGGLADFSQGLSVDAVRSASGAPLAFAPSAISAVPEPGTGASLLAGLALLGAAGSLRRRSQR